MAKKAKHAEHENLERWLVSYADFITLLFATFVALFAMAQQDLAKMKDAAKAIRQGFEQQSIIHGAKTILNIETTPGDDSTSIKNDSGGGEGVMEFENMVYVPGTTQAEKSQFQQTIEQLAAAAGEIAKAVQQAIGQDKPGHHAPGLGEAEPAAITPVQVTAQERGIRVSFDSRLLFEPGTATLKQTSEKALDVIAKRLSPYNRTHMIHIEGHTDNLPIASAIYPSNWELSAARASTVVRYLIRKHGFSPDSLVAVGYGDSQPLTANTTPEGRAKNRRVDIIIHSRKASAEIDPRGQYASEKTLIRFEERDANNEIIIREQASDHKPVDAPAKLIIQGSDGSVEKVITPKSVSVEPAIKPDLGTYQTDKTKTKDSNH